MAGYIGTQAVSVNTTSATISDDLAVGDDATITGDLDVDGTTNLDVVDIDGAVNMATTALVTGVLTTTAAAVFNGGFVSGNVGTFPNGTVDAPAIGNTGDANTGMFFPADNTIAFTEGGVERVRIDANGKVGFGTADPTAFNSSASQFVISAGGDTGLTIDATSSTSSSIHFADGSDGTESYRGYFSYNHAQDRMNMGAGATDVLRLLNGGNVDLVNGNLVVASGHGIDFSATSDGAGTDSSELLDDYEEGTWTPNFKQGSNSPAAYSTQYGYYIKVGRVVHANAFLVVNGLGSMSGALLLDGLPYTVANQSNNYSTLSVGYYEGLNLPTANTNLHGYATPNQVYCNMRIGNSTSASTSITAAQLSADGGMIISVTYRAT